MLGRLLLVGALFCSGFLVPISARAQKLLPPRIQQAEKPVPYFDRVLFVPGAGGQLRDLNIGPISFDKYFGAFEEHLFRFKIKYYTHAVSETGHETIEVRVANLKKHILQLSYSRKNAGEKILLVGHSMGGLVGRLVLRDPEVWNHVAGVVQIATPNLGSPLIDAVYNNFLFGSAVNFASRFTGFNLNSKQYLKQLSQRHVIQNYVDPDLDFQDGMPPVYSIVAENSDAGLILEVPGFALTTPILKRAQQSAPKYIQELASVWGNGSDGLVPVTSQVWGNVLGIFKGGHAAVIGKTITFNRKSEFEVFVLDLIDRLRPGTLSKCERITLGLGNI